MKTKKSNKKSSLKVKDLGAKSNPRGGRGGRGGAKVTSSRTSPRASGMRVLEY